MIREVIINGVLADSKEDDSVALFFDSPVFSDISKIKSNGTSTYRIPKTQNNLNIIGLMNNPDAKGTFPYNYHSFEEYRNGIPIIQKGVCKLLSITDSIELQVLWGNMNNFTELLNKNLRELASNRGYLDWDNDIQYMHNGSSSDWGFLFVDFGRGFESKQFVHPSINIKGILDLIELDSGIKFDYSQEFSDIFAEKWIPLLTKNTNSVSWEYYTAVVNVYIDNSLRFRNWTDYPQIFVQQYNSDIYTVSSAKIVITGNVYKEAKAASASQPLDFLKLIPRNLETGEFLHEHTQWIPYDNSTGYYRGEINLELQTDEDFRFSLFALDNNPVDPLGGSDSGGGVKVVIMHDEVPFNSRFPIAPNLPDISCIDFIKSIMHMFGLFSYYDIDRPDTIIFISIDDIYSLKNVSHNWTDKVVKMDKISHTFNDYAQKNFFKYNDSEDLNIDTSGFIEVQNSTLPREKEIIKIKFAPSERRADEDGNLYAYIPLYDEEGKLQNTEARILGQVVFDNIKAGLFLDNMKFGTSIGLLSTYYSLYQRTILRPVTVEIESYLSEKDIYDFSEITPIYIHGSYYMPITVSLYNNGLAKSKLLLMPNEKSPN